jgi:hypothetical protein
MMPTSCNTQRACQSAGVAQCRLEKALCSVRNMAGATYRRGASAGFSPLPVRARSVVTRIAAPGSRPAETVKLNGEGGLTTSLQLWISQHSNCHRALRLFRLSFCHCRPASDCILCRGEGLQLDLQLVPGVPHRKPGPKDARSCKCSMQLHTIAATSTHFYVDEH